MAHIGSHINGPGGSATCTLNGQAMTIAVKGWSAEINVRLSRTTEIGDSWEYGDATGLSIAGALVCAPTTGGDVFARQGGSIFTTAPTLPAVFKANLTLQTKTGNTYGGPVNLYKVNLGRDDDTGTLVYAFASDGPWTTYTTTGS